MQNALYFAFDVCFISLRRKCITGKMTDSLVEINPKDWIKLKELYNPDGVRNYIAYTTIDNYIRWIDHDEQGRHIKFFCLNGDFSDGTFVVTVSSFKCISIAVLQHLRLPFTR